MGGSDEDIDFPRWPREISAMWRQAAVSCEIFSLHHPDGRGTDRHIPQQHRPVRVRATKKPRSTLEAESVRECSKDSCPPSFSYPCTTCIRPNKRAADPGRLHPRCAVSDGGDVPDDGSHTCGSLHDPIVPRRSVRLGISSARISLRRAPSFAQGGERRVWHLCSGRADRGRGAREGGKGASHTVGQEEDEVDTDALKGEV